MRRYCIHCMSLMREGETLCPKCGRQQQADIPSHHLRPGSVLKEKFALGAALGEGGFGITYIGRDTVLDIPVAIKEYYPNGYANRNHTASSILIPNKGSEREEFFAKGKERFLEEARTLAKFSKESGIVEVRDFFEENNTAYIVMEYLEGMTLKSYLEEYGRIPAEKIIKMMMPLMESLAKVHEQGLIHRDISPDNIMIENGRLKLLDFGAARTMSAAANKSLSVMLKPGYAPEEQYRSKGKQGAWTDVYALCATLYKCITGVVPDDATERVLEDSLQMPSSMGIRIRPAYEQAIMKGLSVLQKDRYQSIAAFIEGLKGADQRTNAEETTQAHPAKESEDEQETRYMAPEKTAETNRRVSEDDINTVYDDSARMPDAEEEERRRAEEAQREQAARRAESERVAKRAAEEAQRRSEAEAERKAEEASRVAAEKEAEALKKRAAEEAMRRSMQEQRRKEQEARRSEEEKAEARRAVTEAFRVAAAEKQRKEAEEKSKTQPEQPKRSTADLVAEAYKFVHQHQLQKLTAKKKSKKAAVALTVFSGIGFLGIQNFYLGNTAKGIAQLALSFLALGLAESESDIATNLFGPLIAFSIFGLWFYDLFHIIPAKEHTKKDPGYLFFTPNAVVRILASVFCPKGCLYEGAMVYRPYKSRLSRGGKLAAAGIVLLILVEMLFFIQEVYL